MQPCCCKGPVIQIHDATQEELVKIVEGLAISTALFLLGCIMGPMVIFGVDPSVEILRFLVLDQLVFPFHSITAMKKSWDFWITAWSVKFRDPEWLTCPFWSRFLGKSRAHKVCPLYLVKKIGGVGRWSLAFWDVHFGDKTSPWGVFRPWLVLNVVGWAYPNGFVF